MSSPIPVGVVGVGALGRHHARHYAKMHGAELVGVYDADPARAALVAAVHELSRPYHGGVGG